MYISDSNKYIFEFIEMYYVLIDSFTKMIKIANYYRYRFT